MSIRKAILRSTGAAASRLLSSLDVLLVGRHLYPGDEANHNNPYLWFNTLRSKAPIVRTYANRGWLVLGFEEVQAAFKDPRFSSDMRKNRFIAGLLRAASDGASVQLLDDPSMLNLDPPDHTRLRKLVSRGFLRNHILSLEPNILRIVDECLSTIPADADGFDLMERLARPLPAIVIAELMGLPDGDREMFQRWSNDLIGITVLDDPEMMARGNAANNKLVAYFETIIEAKRKQPSQDLIGQLIAAEEEGDRLSADEMYSTCVLLLLAGHETTTRLIGNGMYTLLKHPDQLALLTREPELASNAVEEMLRFEPPVQLMPRFATEDLDFYGTRIRQDQLVVLVIASANRDPAANANPDTFDIERPQPTHVSFGYGIHLCLGLTLARLEARIAINALLRKFPDLSLAPQKVDWQPGGLVRGMEHLYINTGRQSRSSPAAPA